MIPGQCPVPRLVGKPKATNITLRWASPDYNGGAPVVDYEVEMELPDASKRLVHKSKEIECTVSDLNPGCSYSFKVRATNRVGPGPFSETVTIASGAAPPEAPGIPTVVCKSPFQVILIYLL